MRFPFQLRESSEFDVVGFGTNAVDYLIRMPEYPRFDSKLEYRSASLQAGGEIASTMVGLQRLGFKTAYAGRFGSDANGELGLRSLTAEGVDTRFAEIIMDAETQTAFILIDERSGERTILWKRDKRLGYLQHEAPLAAAGVAKILHLTPHDTAAAIAMAMEAKRHDIIVTADIDNVFDGIEALLPLVDVVIASQDLPEKIVGESEPGSSLRVIAERFGPAVVGVTLGAAGSLFICGGEFIESSSFSIPGGCVDTTGAGDAFRTGFLFGMLTGETVEGAAICANAVAALKCRAAGARAALPSRRELDDLIAQR